MEEQALLKQNKEKIKTIRIVMQVVFALLLVVTFGLYLYGQCILKNPNLFNPVCEDYTGTWTLLAADGTSEEYVAPATLDVASGETVTLETVLPEEIGEDYVLCIKTGRSFTAYVDGEERYTFDATKRKFPGDVVKSSMIPIPLKASDAGKTLTVVRFEEGSNNSNLNEVYIGNRIGVFFHLFRDNSLQFLMAVILAFLSIAILVISVVMRKNVHYTIPLGYMALGTFLAACWCLFDSNLYQFVFDNYYVEGTIEFMLIPLIPIPFLGFLNWVQAKRYENIYNVLDGALAVIFAVFSCLHFSGIKNFEETMPVMNSCVAAVILTCLILIIYDRTVAGHREYRILTVGVYGLIALSILEILLLNLFPVSYRLDGICFILGLYFLLTTSVLYAIHRVGDSRKLAVEATAANKAKSEFLANMSHEIRTPINAIMGMNEMILSEADPNKIREYAQTAQDAGATLLDIVNDILDFSKIEAGKLEIIEGSYNPGQLADSVLQLFEARAKKKGLTLVAEISPELPSLLYGDEKRLKQISINLLNNALKYTDKGSIAFKMRGIWDDDAFSLLLAVKDTGIGIREEDQKKLFETFERVDLKRNQNVEGTGLGLAICERLATIMGGDIRVKSTYGSGSTFSVAVPQKIEDKKPIGDFKAFTADQSAKRAQRRQSWSLSAPNASVLSVDDNDINLKVLAGLMSKMEIVPDNALSGFEMLEKVKNKKYDIIFLDHMMPEMDGIETIGRFLAQAENINRETPVIALTANAISGAKETYLAAGFTDYLSKPVRPDELTAILRTYLPEELVEEKE